MNIDKWLYIIDMLSFIHNIFGFTLFLCYLFMIGLLSAWFLDRDIGKSKDWHNKITSAIKKYKLIYVLIFMFVIFVLIPSKNVMITLMALNADTEQVENLTPIQQKALKSIEAYLDMRIGKMEQEKHR